MYFDNNKEDYVVRLNSESEVMDNLEEVFEGVFAAESAYYQLNESSPSVLSANDGKCNEILQAIMSDWNSLRSKQKLGLVNSITDKTHYIDLRFKRSNVVHAFKFCSDGGFLKLQVKD